MLSANKKSGTFTNVAIMCENCGSVGHRRQFCTANAIRIVIDAQEGDKEATLFYSTNRWAEGNNMRYIAYRKQFECLKFFPAGMHQFKINVNRADWRCSEYFPICKDNDIENNVITVAPSIQEVALIRFLHTHMSQTKDLFPAFCYPRVVVNVMLILRKTSVASMLKRLNKSTFSAVELWGSWNDWSSPQGPHFVDVGKIKTYTFLLKLEARTYAYKFTIDGQWIDDPYRTVADENGFLNHTINIAEEINKEIMSNNLTYELSSSVSAKYIELEGLPVAPLYAHSMSVIGEEIFIFGGKIRDSLSNSLYVLSDTHGTLKVVEKSGPNAPHNLVSQKSIAYGQKLIIFGFRNGKMETEFYVYCTLAKKWFDYVFPETPIRFEHYSLVGKKGGAHFYVYGGYAWCGQSAQELINTKIFLFSIPTMKFKELPVIDKHEPTPRFHHSAVFIEWDMFVFGGCRIEGNRRVLNNELWAVDLFDHQNLKWRQISKQGPWPEARYGHAAEVIAYNLFIYGGVAKCEEAERIIGDLWCWNVISSGWHQIFIKDGTLRESAFSTMISVDNELFIFGGKPTKAPNTGKLENMLLKITF